MRVELRVCSLDRGGSRLDRKPGDLVPTVERTPHRKGQATGVLEPHESEAVEPRNCSAQLHFQSRCSRRPRQELGHHGLRDNVGGLRLSSTVHVDVVPVPMQYPRCSQRNRLHRTRGLDSRWNKSYHGLLRWYKSARRQSWVRLLTIDSSSDDRRNRFEQ